MSRAKIFLILLMCLCLPLTACLNLKQPRNKIDYYSLEYDPPRISDHQLVSHVIKVAQFSVSPIYNTRKIIYRDEAYKRTAYGYHKWQANPAELVTYFLARDMQQSGLFKAVVTHNNRFPHAYVLGGNVDKFLESDLADGWQADLSLNIILISEHETDACKKIVFQKSYHIRKPCRQKNPQALAEAMSAAMSEASAQIISDIYNRLPGH
ncbi:MAG: ABC-type transport auxiliary lipoprotein family protein [Desulfobacterales bacterium]|jgi:cholesterol transport system auxiliary component